MNIFFWVGDRRRFITKSANNYKSVHYLQRQRHRHKKEQYNKEKERKEREWQPLITSECSSYYPQSTYIRA